MNFPDKEYLEHTTLATDLGTLYYREYEDGEIWLGLSEGHQLHNDPEVCVCLTKSQIVALRLCMCDITAEEKDACGKCGGELRIVCCSCGYEEEVYI